MPNEQDQKRGAQNKAKGGAQEVAEKAEAAVGGAVQSVREIGQTAADKYQEYSEQASETYESSREQVNQWLVDLRERATDEPVKTLLKAAGVGIVLGVLFG
jgi:hypothetical protein